MFWASTFAVIGLSYVFVRVVAAPFKSARCHPDVRTHYDFFHDVDRCDKCNMACD